MLWQIEISWGGNNVLHERIDISIFGFRRQGYYPQRETVLLQNEILWNTRWIFAICHIRYREYTYRDGSFPLKYATVPLEKPIQRAMPYVNLLLVICGINALSRSSDKSFRLSSNKMCMALLFLFAWLPRMLKIVLASKGSWRPLYMQHTDERKRLTQIDSLTIMSIQTHFINVETIISTAFAPFP